MGHKDCFGSLKEVTLPDGRTMTQSRPECRNCGEIRDCLRYPKQLADEKREKDELRKQNLITQIIDHSNLISNELGSCLLKFLSRIYSSSLGAVLFKNLFLFFEIPQKALSSNLSIPISRTMMDLLRGEKDQSALPPNPYSPHQQRTSEEGFTLRIILFEQSFPKNPEANMGMIAHEVARAFASNELGIKQILQALSESEASQLKKLDLKARTRWLVEKFGFLDEFNALKKELTTQK
ncbi:MAG: hypothetical protein A2169_03255 [Deltaproteobacteria bacterium RBG_13_47_9]|nr:MAG: hypothetical protein A2169_03255 [Deltaproteobacteria bacterium RBG_13_47_9]